MTDEDGTGRFFRSFANAMLERSLPAIREWLTSRLGDGAKVGSVELDEGRVIVKDAHVPIGARLWLDVDEASLDAHPEDLMAGLPPARLRSLSGAIRAVEGSTTTFEAPVEIEGRGGSSQAWVDGELRLGGATWKLERGVGDAMPMYGTAQIRITADGWSLNDATLTSGASRTRLSVEGSLRAGGKRIAEGRLETEYARLGHALDVIAAFRGEEVRLPIPAPLDACIDGTVSLEKDGTLHADLNAQSERSDLGFRLESKGRNITSLELDGTMAADELLPASVDAFLDRSKSDPLTVEAGMRGSLDALEGQIELGCAALAGRWLKERHEARGTLVLDGSKYSLELELDGAGHARGDLSVAPYGSIDGHATLSLLPGAWQIASIDASGSPVEVEVQIGGTRSLPDLKLEAHARELAIVRGGEDVVALKRVSANGTLAIEERRARLVDASLRARVGPGSIEVHKDDVVRLKAARVDADVALRAIGLFVEQSLIGRSSDEARFVVPGGSQIWAELAIDGPRVNGTAHVHGPRSCISLAPLRIDGRSFDGTEARATLAYDDAVSIGLFRGSPIVPTGPGAAELTLKLVGVGPAMLLRASASARRVEWRFANADAELVELRDAEVDLEIRRGAIELRSLSGRIFDGRLEAAGGIRSEGGKRVVALDRLSVRGAGRGLRERLFGSVVGDAWSGLSIDLDLAGDLDGLIGEATVTSDRSQLAATITTSGRAFLEGSGVRGRLDPADLAPWLGPVRVEGDPFTLDAQVGGTWASPAVVLTMSGGEQRVKAANIVVPVERARLEATIDRNGARWTTLRATVAGGTVESAGIFDRTFGGTLARVSVEGVRLGAIEGVAAELGGTLFLDASVWQRGGPIGARVNARVEDPRYEALRRLAATFSRYGLLQPKRQGTEPLTLTLRTGDGALEIRDAEASIDGVFALAGHVTRSEIGTWRGEVRVTAKEAWLSTSHLLTGAAKWLGDVTIPIRLDGRDGALRAHAELLAALDGILARTAVGRGLQRAIDKLLHDVLDMAPTPASPPRHHAVSTVTASDALIDRIAEDAPEADAAIGALLERGFDPAEIVERVKRRR